MALRGISKQESLRRGNKHMQTGNKLLSDLAKLGGSAAGLLLDMKHEVEAMVSAKFEAWAARMDLVTREEFNTVKALAVNAKAEAEVLEKRIKQLETTLSGQANPKKTSKKEHNS